MVGGGEQVATMGGTSMAKPRYCGTDVPRAGLPLVRGPSPESGAQRQRNLLSLSLSGVKGGLELHVGLKVREDPHATPLGSQRAFVHVEEKANVHQL